MTSRSRGVPALDLLTGSIAAHDRLFALKIPTYDSFVFCARYRLAAAEVLSRNSATD